MAPYNWTYPGMDEDYTQSGLDRTINNWQQVAYFIALVSWLPQWNQVLSGYVLQIGDFNWLSTDRPSPNWSILPETERRANWEETP